MRADPTKKSRHISIRRNRNCSQVPTSATQTQVESRDLSFRYVSVYIKPRLQCRQTLGLGGIICLAVLVGGCTASYEISRGKAAIERGDLAGGLKRLQKVARENPGNGSAQSAYYLNRDAALGDLNKKAARAAETGDTSSALKGFQEILDIDPNNDRASQGLREIARHEQHKAWRNQAYKAQESGQIAQAERWLNEVLAENPNDREARNQLMEMRSRSQQEARLPPALKKSFGKPVSLELRQVSLQSIFEILSQSAGLNFVLDQAVRADERATIFAKNTTVEDSLNLLMATNNLAFKTLNDSTLLIYPATVDKRRKYDDLIIKTFPVGNGNPKTLSELIKSFVKTADVFSDERSKSLVVRDTQENITIVEKLLSANDIPDAEVVLEIEILEVNTDKLANIGIQYPTQAKASVIGSNKVPGVIPLPELSDLNRNNFLITLGDPLAILNLKYTDGLANTLANPRIRVRNHEKAKVLIGDKVPVITTTNNTTSGTISESVSYLDVGLKLEVEPDVHINNDVSMSIGLEVSDIVKEITSTTGLVAYQIGTRNANTSLRLRDGETQALAGLIRREEKESASRIPGLGSIPLLGKLFSNESRTQKRSELVLLITPHIVRSRALPSSTDSEILVGTADNPGTVLRLRNGSRLSNAGASVINRSIETASTAATAPQNAAETEPVAMFDPSLARIRLNLVSPGQVKAGQEFTLAVMANSMQSFKSMDLRLELPPDTELIRTTAGSGIQLQSEMKEGALALSANSNEVRMLNGPLAMLTLRVKTPKADGKIVTRVQKAIDIDQQDILVYAGDPRTITISQ